MKPVILSLLVVARMATPVGAQPPEPTPVVAATVDLSTLTLVRSTDGAAVIRAEGRLHTLGVGNRVGRTAATVREIAANRLVLEEVTKAADGTPQRVHIILRDGETGGRRFTRQSGSTPPPAVRPRVVAPPNGSDPNGQQGPGPRR